MPVDADVGEYIDDFIKSDSPQFKGKSKEKRKEMAIAAYMSKQKGEWVLDKAIEKGKASLTKMYQKQLPAPTIPKKKVPKAKVKSPLVNSFKEFVGKNESSNNPK